MKNNLPIYLALALSLLLMIVARVTHDAGEYPFDEQLALAGGDTDRDYTSIIISGKTLVIKAAQGYSPIITSDQDKPLIILERDPSQTSTTHFDQIIVVNEDE